jgi:hypothetical protein
MLSGANEMLTIRWLPLELSHACDDVSTAVFDRTLVIANPFHILESVQFQLPVSLIIWHASHELLDAIPIFQASATQSYLFLFQHIVIVSLHALLRNLT